MNIKNMNNKYKTEFSKDMNETPSSLMGYSSIIGGLATRKLVEIGEKQLANNSKN